MKSAPTRSVERKLDSLTIKAYLAQVDAEAEHAFEKSEATEMGGGPRVEDIVRPGTLFRTLQHWRAHQAHSLSYALLFVQTWEAASWQLTSKTDAQPELLCSSRQCQTHTVYLNWNMLGVRATFRTPLSFISNECDIGVTRTACCLPQVHRPESSTCQLPLTPSTREASRADVIPGALYPKPYEP